MCGTVGVVGVVTLRGQAILPLVGRRGLLLLRTELWVGCRAEMRVGMGWGRDGRLARAMSLKLAPAALYSKCKGLGDPER